MLLFYDDGNGAKHKRMDPSDATSYLTTKGKSFSARKSSITLIRSLAIPIPRWEIEVEF